MSKLAILKIHATLWFLIVWVSPVLAILLIDSFCRLDFVVFYILDWHWSARLILVGWAVVSLGVSTDTYLDLKRKLANEND